MDSKRPTSHLNNSSGDITLSVDDDPLIDGPLISQDALESAMKREFQKLPTSWIAGLMSFVHVVYVSVCVVLATLCWLTETYSTECSAVLSQVDSRTFVILGKVVVWFLFFIFERTVQYHHSAARQRGYLQFYRATRDLKRAPLLLNSIGNAAVLAVLSFESPLEKKVKNLSVYLLLVVIILELLVSVSVLIIYTVRVVKFNTERPSPDISQEEQSHAYSNHGFLTHTETGFRDGSSLEEVVEKQADLIEYLKQHNTSLSKRILALTSQQIRE
ncbi:transmembrane protein 192 [Chanos chanos]|uniref:Transmembrane protein 192 n=1 Tax=Chanos chanos TaxID=29144 RepID=A0A6J2WII1_CHACN|nr:transmembrane protein 192 [Chanos chanos]